MLKRFHPFALSRNHLMNIWDHFHSLSIFPSNSSSVFIPGLHFWVNQIQMCSVQANFKVQICFHPLLWLAAGNGRSKGRTNSPPSCILGVRVFSFLPAFFRHWQDGLSTWQSCTPSYIQPQHPLWRHPWPEPRGGINWWWWACGSDLMCLYISCHSFFFYVYHFTAYWIYLNASHSWN